MKYLLEVGIVCLVLHSDSELNAKDKEMREPKKTVVITENQRNAYLDSDFNPPNLTKSFTRADYVSEWQEAYALIRAKLEEHWKYGIGDGDFFIDGDTADDRLLCVEVTNPRIIGIELLNAVQQAVDGLTSSYSVDICNSFVYLRKPDESVYPEFNIFVERKRTLIYSASRELFGLLGVKPTDHGETDNGDK